MRVPAWTEALLMGVVLMLGAAACENRNRALPVMGEVPEFSLVDQDGQVFQREDLIGRPTVVNFIFTSCQTTCPVLTAQMKQTTKRLEGRDVAFVSISVDPQTDTPERLHEYAEHFDADWTFLTGPHEDVKALVIDGFKTAMGKMPSAADPSLLEVVHGERFVLLDAQAQIRGFYELDADGREALDAAVQSLL